MNEKTKRLAMLGMFSAIAYVFTVFARIPISSVEFLKYDPKDIIIVIAGFIAGPLSAFAITVVVSLIEAITVSTTGLIGFVMNVLSTVAFACTASLIYKKRRTLGGAIIGLICGVTLMCGIMLLWNYLVTPLYMSLDREVIASMLLPVFLPFNLIKGSINSALAMLIYKPVVRALKSTRLLEGKEDSRGDVKFSVIAICVLVLVSCVLGILIIKGVL